MKNSAAKKMTTMSEALHRAQEILNRLNGTQNPIGAEIGVAIGQTSECLLQRHDLKLIMVDSYRPSEEQTEAYKASGDRFGTLTKGEQDAHKRVAEEVTRFAEPRRALLNMDSLEAAKTIPDGSLDFVFIDADHSYEGASADISAWHTKVKPGGWLCGHDYWLVPDPSQSWTQGPKRAVDEFVAERNLRLELGLNYTWFVRL